MSTVLMVIGLLIVLAGVFVFLFRKAEPIPVAHAGVTADTAKILEQLNKMFALFDKRYRPGMFLMLVGLALIGAGLFLETRDTKDAVEAVAVLAPPSMLRIRAL